jgi:hypothetical protein
MKSPTLEKKAVVFALVASQRDEFQNGVANELHEIRSHNAIVACPLLAHPGRGKIVAS